MNGMRIIVLPLRSSCALVLTMPTSACDPQVVASLMELQFTSLLIYREGISKIPSLPTKFRRISLLLHLTWIWEDIMDQPSYIPCKTQFKNENSRTQDRQRNPSLFPLVTPRRLQPVLWGYSEPWISRDIQLPGRELTKMPTCCEAARLGWSVSRGPKSELHSLYSPHTCAGGSSRSWRLWWQISVPLLLVSGK